MAPENTITLLDILSEEFPAIERAAYEHTYTHTKSFRAILRLWVIGAASLSHMTNMLMCPSKVYPIFQRQGRTGVKFFPLFFLSFPLSMLAVIYTGLHSSGCED